VHGSKRRFCKECKEEGCGGGSLCAHGRQKSVCKECWKEGCGGGSLCAHGRKKSVCKEGCRKQKSALLSAQDQAEQGKPNGLALVATLTFAAARL
jgi:hypothetical protein